jgi:hypothetical protein
MVSYAGSCRALGIVRNLPHSCMTRTDDAAFHTLRHHDESAQRLGVKARAEDVRGEECAHYSRLRCVGVDAGDARQRHVLRQRTLELYNASVCEALRHIATATTGGRH